MVLTNFESWAHGGSQPNNENISGAVGGSRRNLDLFNLSVIQACHAGDPIQCNNNMTIVNGEPQQQNQSEEQQILTINSSVNVSHISSNGYYGYSQICCQQNNENSKKVAMSEDMMDVEQILVSGGGTTRKRLHETNIYHAKKCRFDDNDSQFDEFCQTSFAPNSLTDLTMDHQSIQQNIGQQSKEQQNYMINNNLPEPPSTTIYERKLLSASVTNNNSHNNNISYEPKVNDQNNTNNNKFDNLNLKDNQNAINNNFKFIDDINNCKNGDKLLMENLYFNTHGGGYYQYWQHLSNRLDDI